MTSALNRDVSAGAQITAAGLAISAALRSSSTCRSVLTGIATSPGLQRPQERPDEVDAVRQGQQYPVAWHQPGLQQRGGGTPGPLVNVAVRILEAIRDIGGPVRPVVAFGQRGQSFDEIPEHRRLISLRKLAGDLNREMRVGFCPGALHPRRTRQRVSKRRLVRNDDC
ncbi:hypothetical protein BJ970_005919 [Saccharopolyspora phatthalungensis]|uniref:Uncharacterized protein n=1 Tax=Saccharopolyspora phatthalungensis TaxID=664693 RepID=A0A840QEN6_9PSEU|nr:hypothetical protein [Saccharopolyspora phatthalungensis]